MHLPPTCLKCGSSDYLTHSFWYCEKVKKTWLDIERWLSNICKQKFVFTPEACLLQNVTKMKYPMGWQLIFSSLVYKKLLLQNWKNTDTPGLEKWKNVMKYYLNISGQKSVSGQK